MDDLSVLNTHYIKNSIRTISQPSNTLYNNPYCYALLSGIVENPDDAWFVSSEGDTVFTSSEVEKDFMAVLDLFFRNKWIDEPTVSGVAENEYSDFSIISKGIALEAKGKVLIKRTVWMSSDSVYPFQFLATADDVSLDTDSPDFVLKDFIWFVYRPGGFVLSLSAEQFGVLSAFLSDNTKYQHRRTYSENVKQTYRQTFQEKMFKAFAQFYMYLKETSPILNTVYTL